MTDTTPTRVKRSKKTTAKTALTLARLREVLPDRHVDDIVDVAGIGYWATEVPREIRERICASYAERHVEISYVFGEEGEDIIALTRDDVRLAYGRLLDLEQTYVGRSIHDYVIDSYRHRDADGIELAEIDSDAGDILVQVAAFDEVVFG